MDAASTPSDNEQYGPERSLSSLLSQTFIAFTIEFDNEFEQRMPHRTTVAKAASGSTGTPWLVSLAMWSNFMQFVDDDGVTVGEFARRARLSRVAVKSWLERLSRWWGYLAVAPEPADVRAKPPHVDWVVRPTPGGRKAIEVWRSLFGIIEERWELRFGRNEIAALRESLQALVREVGAELPGYLPVLGYGLFANVGEDDRHAAARNSAAGVAGLQLYALLSKALLAFTREFERESELSLAICANALRVVTENGVRERDVPTLTGVSKEAVGMALGFLLRHGYVAVAPDSTVPRTKVVRLTIKGQAAQQTYRALLDTIEGRLSARLRPAGIRRLRESLERLLAAEAEGQPLLGQGLMPRPGGWRTRKPYLAQTAAFVRDPSGRLPQYPMILHRGGWPDGS